MMKNRGLAFKLAFLILTCSIAIFLAIFLYTYIFSRRMIVTKIESNARHLTFVTANKIESVLSSAAQVPENFAYFLEVSGYTRDDLVRLLEAAVRNNPEIYGAAVAFEPYAFDKNSRYFAPYVFEGREKLEVQFLGDASYDYFTDDYWYQLPKELNRPVWSEPYFDEGAGNILMCTYSVPFYRMEGRERRFSGIASADISLSWLQHIVSSVKVAKSGYGFLITRTGTIVTHPARRLVMNETIFSIAEERGDAALRAIGREMIRGQSGFAPSRSIVSGKECWIAYAPIPSTGWSLGVVFPRDELMMDVIRFNRGIMIIGILGFVLLFALIVAISSSITRPLRKLAIATRDIGRGNLDFTLAPARSQDEVGRLTESFVYMRDALKKYIKELTEATAAKERIESELKIAREIQTNLLPRIFPPFPQKNEIDIYATMDPAREVGGDFYDFFLVGEKKLCFLIGDVSGKGIPAALFMTISKTLLKTEALRALAPDEILLNVNNILVPDNHACMFVTLFCAVLDLDTGVMQYANGGHNPPLVYQPGAGFEFLDVPKSPVVGAIEGISFPRKELRLAPGAMVFLYTDGVTEAVNGREEMFGATRLKQDLERLKGRGAAPIIEGIHQEIRAFVQGTAQFDDITMLALQYRGKGGLEHA